MDEQQLLNAHLRDMNEIEKQGRDRYGAQAFDDACTSVVKSLGGMETGAHIALGATVKAFDNPAEIIMHLDAHPERLDAIKKMTPARQMVELAKIQSQVSPHGNHNME